MTKVNLNKYVKCGSCYEVILTNRLGLEVARAKIDKEDLQKVMVCRWSYTATTQTTQGWIRGKITTMHQAIMGKKKGFVIDHKNHDRLDNRRTNIRYATKSQNAMNQKVKGVHLCKERPNEPNWKKRWKAQLKAGEQRLYKFFYTEEEAIAQRKQWEEQYFGEFKYNLT